MPGIISDKATDRDVRKVAEELLYIADGKARAWLMRECPAAYNAVCGWEVVKVIHTSDGMDVMKS